MSLLRAARLRPARLSSATNLGAASSALSLYSTANLQVPFKRSSHVHEHRLIPGRLQQRISILSPSPSRHPTHRFASTSTAQPTSTPAPYPSSATSQSSPSAPNSSDATPATVLSTSSTSSTSTPPTTPTTTPPSPSPATTPLATALSAELSSLPPPPPPSPTASFLARPFITALHDYPLPLLLALTTLELSSFSLTSRLLTAAGVVFSSTFAWAYLISVPIRRSAIVKGVVGVPLGVVVGVMFPWFKEIRITELRRKSARQVMCV